MVCLGVDLQLTDCVSQEICAPEEPEPDSFSIDYLFLNAVIRAWKSFVGKYF